MLSVDFLFLVPPKMLLTFSTLSFQKHNFLYIILKSNNLTLYIKSYFFFSPKGHLSIKKMKCALMVHDESLHIFISTGSLKKIKV